MKVLKNLGIVLACIVCAFCVGIDGWYLYVCLFAPDKVISVTHEVGLQKLENSDDSRYFIEVNYFSNEEENGLEMLDIKFNYMLDENQEAFYSQGLQFVANSQKEKIDFNYKLDKSVDPVFKYHEFAWPIPAKDYYTQWGGYRLSDSATSYNYASADDYEHVMQSTNPISDATRFKIQLGDDLFLMKFKNLNTEATHDNYMYQYQGDTKIYVLYNIETYYDCHAYSDYNYFCKLIYDSLQTVTPGTNSAMVFEFGDLFDYYKYDEESRQYSSTAVAETEKIHSDIQSYYAIKVTTSASGAQQASDSLFGAVNGSTTYNKLGTFSDDYFIGRSYYTVTERDFDLVTIEVGYCVLKLKEAFIEEYGKYDTIVLIVKVNLDYFSEKNIKILGFATDSGLNDFNVRECYFLETVNGEVVQTEVDYA